jgi:hypothetical protein
MDTGDLVLLPLADDLLDADLREVDVAIEMVVRGSAVRVRLVGLNDPETVAPIALARAQFAGIDFHVDHGVATSLTFGPSD